MNFFVVVTIFLNQIKWFFDEHVFKNELYILIEHDDEEFYEDIMNNKF
jgi:hypothetical protein